MNTVGSREFASTVDSFLPWNRHYPRSSRHRVFSMSSITQDWQPLVSFSRVSAFAVKHTHIHTYTDHTYSSSEKNEERKRNEKRRLACVYHSTNLAIRKKRKKKKNERYTAKQYQIYIYIYIIYLSIVYFNTPRSCLKLCSKRKSTSASRRDFRRRTELKQAYGL